MGETEVVPSADERSIDRKIFVTRAAATTALAGVAHDRLSAAAQASHLHTDSVEVTR